MPERVEHLEDQAELAAEVLGRLPPVGLVLDVLLVPERRLAPVERHREMGRLLVAEHVDQHRGEPVDRVGRLPRHGREVLDRQREECPVGQRMTVEQEQPVLGPLRLSPRSDPMGRTSGGVLVRHLRVARGGRGPRVKRWCVLRVEREDGGRVLGLARLQHGGREVGLVGRVREVLGLEGVRLALAVGVAADADEVTVEEVAGVELHARLVGPDGQQPAAARVKRACGHVEAGRTAGPGWSGPSCGRSRVRTRAAGSPAS